MADLKLPKQDSATGRALKSAAFAVSGFVIGLVYTVWAVPGVPAAVIDYVQKNAWQVLLTIGIPAGLLSFIWNFFRKNVPNY